VRATLDRFLARWSLFTDGFYLLHADMWRFPLFARRAPGRCVNLGLGESNLLNVAAGLASQGNRVFVYGVCGFVIHRYEQLKFSVGWSGGVTVVNAGACGSYAEAGPGHVLDDDLCLMSCLPWVRVRAPVTRREFLRDVAESCRGRDVYYIRTGRDGCSWKT
jgi:transketolase